MCFLGGGRRAELVMMCFLQVGGYTELINCVLFWVGGQLMRVSLHNLSVIM